MNALKSLDTYLSRSSNSRPPSAVSTPVRSNVRLREAPEVPESILNLTDPVPAVPVDSDSSLANQARGRLRRRATPLPPTSPNGSQKRKRRRKSGIISTDAEKRRKKRRRLPSSDGWLGGAYVAVLALWVSLWSTVFGDTERFLKDVRNMQPDSAMETKQDVRVEDDNAEIQKDVREGSGSESEMSDKNAEDGLEVTSDWVDPVTRAPGTDEELSEQAATADVPPPVRARERAESASRERSLPDAVSFRLRSSSRGEANALQKYEGGAGGVTISILTNPTPTDDVTVDATTSSSRRTKLLPNPLAPTLLTTRGKGQVDISQPKVVTANPYPNRPISIPRAPLMTPFHLPKTLILDLDETLIHSTSRAMTIQSSGVGGGSGLVGINLSGLFGSQRRGGGGARGEGHTVEVVLGGRSTLYHVYKRPFVDHFLKKVSLTKNSLDAAETDAPAQPGLFLVHLGHFHCIDAGICGSCHRLA